MGDAKMMLDHQLHTDIAHRALFLVLSQVVLVAPLHNPLLLCRTYLRRLFAAWQYYITFSAVPGGSARLR